MAASQIGDLGDFIRSFPQFTYDDYLYRLSMAQVLFLTVDSTHIKYLRGKDNYCSIHTEMPPYKCFKPLVSKVRLKN